MIARPSNTTLGLFFRSSFWSQKVVQAPVPLSHERKLTCSNQALKNMSVIPPNDSIRKTAHVKSSEEYSLMRDRALSNPKEFWLEYAMKFQWQKPPTFDKCLSYNFDYRKGPVFVKWFEDGKTNICYNGLDRHVENGLGDKIAILWEGNDPNDTCRLTFSEVLTKVKRIAKMLENQGVRKGDCVAIYMPMVPELLMTMFACTRLGAIHSVVFGGFSASALADRIMDAGCKILVTADGTWRGSKLIELKAIASSAMSMCQEKGYSVQRCIVFQHVTAVPPKATNGINNFESKEGVRPASGLNVPMEDGRDVWWHQLISNIPENVDCPVEWINAEDPLFILYTSGSTGRPKGVVHTTGGYMVYAATTFFYSFDYHDDDIYWCTADAGWITGHSYVVYGPFLNGATSVVFEGIPTWPDPGRCWAIVDRYQVTKFYTAPTAIRTLIKAGDQYVKGHSRKSLKVLGTVGEPINVSAWLWYYNVVGNGQCSIVDTFWQTETGGHMITSLPGANSMKPGCATKPFFGVDARILSEEGEDLTQQKGVDAEGFLVFAKPWPGMMRTINRNHELFESTYFKRFPGYYVAGDGARIDKDGDFWITGRLDDMLNVSGHLISTAEVENALLLDPNVSEAAVVSRKHPLKGECLYCFVTLKDIESTGTSTGSSGGQLTPEIREKLVDIIRKRIGPFAAPDYIQSAPVLPKTRSGKIMRRILRKIANEDYTFGDTSTLLDHSCLDNLIKLSKSILK
uniref:acetate--CoA ligase n=1 Tax=Trichobilharzia regenti TaxID=157069 RepID=A0AA85IRM8_TRIRE|nr:unnamed protein product [Trichobilharzia regenti]